MPSGQRPKPDPHLVIFGNRVRYLRTVRRLTQEQLAHDAGLHRTVVGYVERAERDIGVSMLWPLAEALDVDVSDLFTSDPLAARDS